jgi:hypothetical protein
MSSFNSITIKIACDCDDDDNNNDDNDVGDHITSIISYNYVQSTEWDCNFPISFSV